MKPSPPTKKRAPEIRALTGARGIPVLLIVAGGLAWRFVERPLGEAMRRRTLSAFDQGRGR